MAVNHLDCLTMDCTSPVEKTEIASDQKYRVKCRINVPTQRGKWLFLLLFSLMRFIIKQLIYLYFYFLFIFYLFLHFFIDLFIFFNTIQVYLLHVCFNAIEVTIITWGIWCNAGSSEDSHRAVGCKMDRSCCQRVVPPRGDLAENGRVVTVYQWLPGREYDVTNGRYI